ncbi:hypothetical protein [Streptomyces demainii]|uniref:Tetratricopeptide (TPR) repeat protein n=1 Tax=Streptomyces demainii TaxID=588122 RepID=A0ABT9L705_9ACTN|nr:hypothetical protein [Streptomyces demainii]MDP9616486.1 tetratricopeptide (TPR) repeat protein [Streptomyces demainii]
MTGPSAHGDKAAPYDRFLAGLGRKASAAECEQWARDHDGDPDVSRALIDAGWQRSRAGDHAQALMLFRRALECGGEQSRYARVGIIEQLYALGRTDEGHTARDALRAELDATAPPDLWIYHQVAELLSEAAAAQPQAALEWCEAALARAGAEDGGEDAAFHRQCLLGTRRVVREQLGLGPDELDQATEAEVDRDVAEAARLLGQMLTNAPLTVGPLAEDGPG